MGTKEKIQKLYCDILALCEQSPNLKDDQVAIHFWHEDRRLCTADRFCGFDGIYNIIGLCAYEQGVYNDAITLSCSRR